MVPTRHDLTIFHNFDYVLDDFIFYIGIFLSSDKRLFSFCFFFFFFSFLCVQIRYSFFLFFPLFLTDWLVYETLWFKEFISPRIHQSSSIVFSIIHSSTLENE